MKNSLDLRESMESSLRSMSGQERSELAGRLLVTAICVLAGPAATKADIDSMASELQAKYNEISAKQNAELVVERN